MTQTLTCLLPRAERPADARHVPTPLDPNHLVDVDSGAPRPFHSFRTPQTPAASPPALRAAVPAAARRCGAAQGCALRRCRIRCWRCGRAARSWSLCRAQQTWTAAQPATSSACSMAAPAPRLRRIAPCGSTAATRPAAAPEAAAARGRAWRRARACCRAWPARARALRRRRARSLTAGRCPPTAACSARRPPRVLIAWAVLAAWPPMLRWALRVGAQAGSVHLCRLAGLLASVAKQRRACLARWHAHACSHALRSSLATARWGRRRPTPPA